MNILLTDLNALPMDLPQRPETAAGGDTSFNHLFREQLPVATGETSQAIDLEYFFAETEVTAEMPPRAVQVPPTEFPAQFPRQHPGQSAGVAIAPAPSVEIAARAPSGILSLQTASAAEGVVLPQSGNPLPAPADGLAPGKVSMPAPTLPEQATSGVQMLVAAAAPTAATGASNAVAVDDAQGRRANPAPALAEMPVPRSPAATSVAAAVSPRAASHRIPAPVAAAEADVDDSPAQAPRAAQAQAPLPVERQMAPAAPRAPVDAGASATPTARGGGEIPPAPAPGGMPEIRRPETAAIEVPAAPRGAVAVDNARQLDSRAAAELASLAARPAAEAGAAAGEAAARGLELPVPAGSAQAQANNVAAPLPQPAMASLQTAAPAQSTALPESLVLARGADATDWGNAVGERVSWMINHKQNSASIRLDPPMLGKLDVQVRVSDDVTTITIQTQHAQTRDLIDAASLRLRDYLQESGFQNVNVDVSQRQEQQQARAQSSSSESGGEQADAAPEQDSDAQRQEAAAYTLGEGLLDTFA